MERVKANSDGGSSTRGKCRTDDMRRLIDIRALITRASKFNGPARAAEIEESPNVDNARVAVELKSLIER